MSRTYKDMPSKLVWGDYSQDYIPLEGYSYRLGKTTKPKIRKSLDTKWKWYKGTPSWWCNLFMNRPIRRKSQVWERKVETSKISAIDELDIPNNSKKPHKYYY